mmetsp:Transcript_2238/g.4109  ORF Transcript_2238/g.4109 Transcript_2238/m.4109 type:complete len:583 (+) Transcript_2238:284-2032(+)
MVVRISKPIEKNDNQTRVVAFLSVLVLLGMFRLGLVIEKYAPDEYYLSGAIQVKQIFESNNDDFVDGTEELEDKDHTNTEVEDVLSEEIQVKQIFERNDEDGVDEMEELEDKEHTNTDVEDALSEEIEVKQIFERNDEDGVDEMEELEDNEDDKESEELDNSDPFSKKYKFFIISPHQVTSSLVEDKTVASNYYRNSLNEDSAEIWLHRAFQNLSYEEGHTLDPSEADVFLIAGYFHLNAKHGNKNTTRDEFIQFYVDSIVDPSKPHLYLIPTTNPTTSRQIGLNQFTNTLKKNGVNLLSAGFERNGYWQRVDLDRIISIPYVVKLQEQQTEIDDSQTLKRVNNKVFYAGDSRKNAVAWAGCNRSLIVSSLHSSLGANNNTTRLNFRVDNIDVQLVSVRNRLAQDDYNNRMGTSEYCLILCGDTPTSRSLTSAMVSGCIPLFLGSRLRGLCDPPCHAGWGWHVSGPENPHLPFGDYISWDEFPEVDEQGFIDNGAGALNEIFHAFDSTKKEKLQTVMQQVRQGWIYGRGDPVTSNDFGDVHKYLWNTFQRLMFNASSSPLPLPLPFPFPSPTPTPMPGPPPV